MNDRLNKEFSQRTSELEKSVRQEAMKFREMEERARHIGDSIRRNAATLRGISLLMLTERSGENQARRAVMRIIKITEAMEMTARRLRSGWERNL